jgi:hypothetical protein
MNCLRDLCSSLPGEKYRNGGQKTGPETPLRDVLPLYRAKNKKRGRDRHPALKLADMKAQWGE